MLLDNAAESASKLSGEATAANYGTLTPQVTSSGENDSGSAGQAVASRSSSRGQLGTVACILRKHLSTGMALYQVPRARYKWGQKQGGAHHVWGSMFFDLVYVGIAYQLSHVLIDGIKSDTILASLGLAISVFSALEMCWQLRLSIDSRYHVDDLAHRLHQITLGACVALAANSVSSLEVMEERGSKQTLIFSSCLLAFTCLDSIPYIEMYFYATEENVQQAAKLTLYGRLSCAIVSTACIISSVHGPLFVTCILWVIFGNLLRFFILFLSVFDIQNKKRSVPMHVNWVIARLQEFNLLMLGECVISIILVAANDTASYIITFLLSFLLIAALALIMFAANVERDDQHAMRRSGLRSVMYLLLQSGQSITLICVGVGLKMILGKADYDEVPVNYIWFMSASLVINLAAFLIGRVFHHGIYEEYFYLPKPSQRAKKITFWMLKLGVLGLTLVAVALHASAWGYMLWYCAMCALVYFVQLVDLRTFAEYHAERIEQEVSQRAERYKQEGFEVSTSNDHEAGEHH